MRRLIVATALLSVATLCASPAAAKKETGPDPMPINEAGEYEYTGVVEVEGATAGELYSRAKVWVVDAYVSAKAVTQLEDKDAHRVIVKGTLDVKWMALTTATVKHQWTIEAKDGRYRYSVTGFVLDLGGKYRLAPDARWSGIKGVRSRTAERIVEMIEHLRKAMTVAVDDDW